MKKVLVVEDNEVTGSLLRDTIEFYVDNAMVILAENGKKGLDFLSRNVISVLITDIEMPQMGGIEMVERAQEEIWKNKGEAPSIFFLSGKKEEFLEEIKGLGIDESCIFSKPLFGKNHELFLRLVEENLK